MRLLALDVDGTLLNSQGAISERTRRAVLAAEERGVVVVLATGRRRRSAMPIAQRLGGNPLLLVSQGAALWRGDELLYHRHLPAGAARKAVETCRACGCVAMVFSHASLADIIWVDGDWTQHERLRGYVARNDQSVRPYGDGCEALARDPVQVVVLDAVDRLTALDAALTASVDGHAGAAAQPRWRVIFSRTMLATGGAIEILHPGTSKAAALEHLCTVLGVSRSEVLAFGDNVNDVEMLQFAGLGVAMGNASPEAREVADLITASRDEDGIAEVLERLCER